MNPHGKEHHSFTGFKGLQGSVYGIYKQRAEAKGLDFTISKEYLWDLFEKQNRKCALTGLDIFFTEKTQTKGYRKTASLDRIDNSKGYIEGNLQWVHKDINLIKRNLTEEQLLFYCEKIIEWAKLKNGRDE